MEPKLTEQESTYLVRKQNHEVRDARRSELKSNIRELEASAVRIKAVAPEAQILADQWSGHLQSLSDTFVHELIVRADLGKTPIIAFDSPGALAYVLGEAWANVLPSLAEKVSGKHSVSSASRSAQLSAINDELTMLRAEYAQLGGV